MYTGDSEIIQSRRDSSGPVSNNLRIPRWRKPELFTEREHLWQNGGMKRHAFEGVFENIASRWRFNYKDQLREATSAVREELDRTVALYVSRFPDTGYRALARRLDISPAKLCEILRPFPHGRKRGRRKAQGTAQPERKDVKQALEVLHLCVANHRADDAGEDAYQNLTDWLEKPRGNKTLRQRAGYLTQRYHSLRSRTNSKQLD